jgi:predicted RecA/RadA family phage recombinase
MYIRLLIFIAIIAGIIYSIIKLKNSQKVDKITEGLFSTPKNNTVDSAIDNIKSSKQTLKTKSAENEKIIKNVALEQEKINQNL